MSTYFNDDEVVAVCYTYAEAITHPEKEASFLPLDSKYLVRISDELSTRSSSMT